MGSPAVLILPIVWPASVFEGVMHTLHHTSDGKKNCAIFTKDACYGRAHIRSTVAIHVVGLPTHAVLIITHCLGKFAHACMPIAAARAV